MALYVFLLILANIFWAGFFSVVKWGVADIHPITLAFYRVLVATVLLWPVVLIFSRRELKKIDSRTMMKIFLVAVLNMVHQAGACVAMNYTSATDATLIISMEPVILFFLATIILKETISFRHIAAIAMALAGFLILSGSGVLHFSAISASIMIGNLIVLVAVVSETSFSIIFKPLADRHPPHLLMAVVTLIQTIMLGPTAYMLDSNMLGSVLTFKGITAVLYMSLFCTIFGYILWLKVMRRVPVNIMAVSLFLQPVFGPLIAGLTLGEVISPRVVAGGAFILTALYISTSFKSADYA